MGTAIFYKGTRYPTGNGGGSGGGGGYYINYSLDEQIIGKWIDGKDLYQKTVVTGGTIPVGASIIERVNQTGYDTIKYTYIDISNIVDIWDGATTITPTASNGITITTSSVNSLIGALSGNEWSANFEGFNIALKDLTVGKTYKLSFDFQFTEAAFFGGGQFVTGFKIFSTNRSDYSDYGNWTNNINRDLLAHTYTDTFEATATTMYLTFNFCGCSDNQTNYFNINNLYVTTTD